MAEAWGELNVVHSFREGNTRTQFVFFSQLAEQAGYQIDTAAFAPGSPLCDEFVQARFHSQDKASNDRLDVEQQWQDLFTERSPSRTAGDAHSSMQIWPVQSSTRSSLRRDTERWSPR